jgi:hypothetical protein
VRELHARLEVMEAMQRRTSVTGDVSDVESEEIEFEEAIGEYASNECFLKAVMKLGARVKIDVPMYEVNLDVEELLDWIVKILCNCKEYSYPLLWIKEKIKYVYY